MHRMSPNNPVRRRLIFDEIEDAPSQNTPAQEITTNRDVTNNQPSRPILEEKFKELARVDNSLNILQETVMRDRKEKSMKWNFDFEKEEALFGQYEWFKKENDDWVPMAPKINNKCFRYLNENTPYHVRDGSAPIAKKRKSNIESITYGPSAKRKIDFD